MGLQGMINDLVQQADFPVGDKLNKELNQLADKVPTAIARIISAAENFPEIAKPVLEKYNSRINPILHLYWELPELEGQENPL